MQKRNVMNSVLSGKEYQPIFAISDYVQIEPGLKNLYDILLKSYNKNNNTNFLGLIFGFAVVYQSEIRHFHDYNSFRNFIISRKPAILSLWKHFLSQDCVVLELEYDDDFNPIAIDINDFQFLMPPIVPFPPYTENSVQRLIENMMLGITERSVLPSDLLQVHAPYINKNNIIGVYPMFELY